MLDTTEIWYVKTVSISVPAMGVGYRVYYSKRFLVYLNATMRIVALMFFRGISVRAVIVV